MREGRGRRRCGVWFGRRNTGGGVTAGNGVGGGETESWKPRSARLGARVSILVPKAQGATAVVRAGEDGGGAERDGRARRSSAVTDDGGEVQAVGGERDGDRDIKRYG
ncbi:hypothetical protein U1Q18_052470 [Sarracenia purpurea var. burkii]